jgi:acyl transferase domain-containing protein/NAD(P)-dependent dehydrogenase (short-subunit alcohol dehydrogenase family)/acyl carrier protein
VPDTKAPAPIDVAQQLRRAMAAVTDMRGKLAAVDAKAHEPIAIVGMACRFPGSPDLASYWRLLVNGDDAIREVPKSRWDVDALYDPDPDAPGKMSTRWGGFIDDVDCFDAGFFGVSPREAIVLDPQQRLLLETAWRALEDAGIAPDSLTGSATGVYVGLSTTDYARVLTVNLAGNGWIDGHASLGNSVAVAAGRLSYTLGLQGPALVVDTACSSSLVATHLAARSLRTGETRLALVGGVNLMLSPELNIGFSKARMMAADGRCKTLDAAADGYVRGEGCGVVALKRLSDAEADGDRIHALILGSAVNQDGRSNGLTAPNGPAQAAVIRAALADARIVPEQVSVIEAHGTGTPLGDPIEVRALASVYGKRAAGGAAARLGSVKTNIGHLEAAAGMAGLIKAALAAEHGVIPAHLHFKALNPHIAADGFPFAVPTKAEPWGGVDGRRIAGVSSFGFSGTNGHVIVGGPPPQTTISVSRTRPPVLALSAADGEGLAMLRASVGAALANPNADWPNLAATLTAGRAQHPHRLAFAASDVDAARKALDGAAAAKALTAPAVAFLFTGQGCQYLGMAGGLMRTESTFRAVIERCDAALGDRLGLSLARLLMDGDQSLTRTDLLQPTLFALELATAELWRSWGVEAAAVLGHSVGEIAAACYAGAISLEDGVVFIAERGRLMERRAGLGGMAAVFADAATVERAITGSGAVIAGLNAPQNTVIAGDFAAMAAACDKLAAAGVAVHKLEVATAFHSALLDPCLDGVEAAAAAMKSQTARLPVAANLTGRLTHRFDPAYWRAQARNPVRFTEGLKALAEKGCRVMLEVGPQPVLSSLGKATLPEAQFIPSLRRGIDDGRMMADGAAALYRAGVPVDWAAYCRAEDGSRGWRPTAAALYPFRRDRFWPEAAEAPGLGGAVVACVGPVSPLLGARVDTPLEARIHQATLSVEAMPFLADHVVFGEVVVPGAMHGVLGLMLAEEAGLAPPAVADLVFAQALVTPLDGAILQTLAMPDGGYAVHSRRTGDEGWTRHATGRLLAASDQPPAPLDLPTLRERLTADDAGPAALFGMLASRGIELGESFQGLTRFWRGEGEALAEICLPPVLRVDAARLPIHPAVLDSCFQLLGATFSGEGTSGGFLPLSIDRLSLWRRPGERFFCHARIADAGPSAEVAVGHFRLIDENGHSLMTVDGLQIKRVAAPTLRDAVADALLAVDWLAAPLTGDLPAADWAGVDAVAWAAKDTAVAANLLETGLGDGLERLAQAYARDALTALDGRTPAHLSREKARLFERLKRMADEQGDGDGAARTLAAAFPDNAADIDMVARCGRGIVGVLRGETDPLTLLFLAESDEEKGVYGRAGLAETANAMAASALSAALARRGAGAAKARVLEIGAGTGATTAALLPVLNAAGGAARYLFTDVSPAFLSVAERRFADAPGFAAAVFDLERAPGEQGFGDERFDIVVAANVVHATADVRRSLEHVRQALAPGGLLILVESTRPQLWWDIVFGLTDGWWRFLDTDLRPDHPLLDAGRWQVVLRESGFGAVAATPVDGPGRQSVIVARAEAGPELLLVCEDGHRDLATSASADLASRGQPARVVSSAQALTAIAGSSPLAGVVALGGVGAVDQQPLHAAFDLGRAMIAAGRRGFTLVTRGVVAVEGAPTAPEAASLWGFGRVAALEHPELACRRVDLDPAGGDGAELAAALLFDGEAGEEEVAWRGGRPLVSRLVPAPLPPLAAPVAFKPDATYLVAGGFGGLGLPLARWLIAHGARTIVLAGRRAPTDELRAALSIEGATVHIRVADVASEAAMTALLDEIDHGMPPLKGIFHLAGSVADGALINQSWETFASVLSAKVDGARCLHRLSLGRTLDHFVLFSTSAALIGNRGQSNHAAANAYLDALAEHRRGVGLPGLSVNWGAWGELGAVAAGSYAAAMAERGVKTFTIAQGLDGLGRAMIAAGGVGRARYGFVAVDWPKFLAGYGGRTPPFLSQAAPKAALAGAKAATRTTPAAPTRDFRALLTAEKPESRRGKLAELLRAEAAEVLGLSDPTRIDMGQALNEIGLDSLLALELRNRLGAALGTPQPATLLFNYPSVEALALHVGESFVDLLDAASSVTVDAERDTEQALAREVLAMTDADLEAFLDQELADLGGVG